MGLTNKKDKKEEAKVVEKKVTVAKKEEKKLDTKVAEDKKVPAKKNYHISKRAEDGKWQVKFANGQKAIKLFDTQAAAIDYAKSLAESQDGLVTIHKVDGKIRKQDYSKK